MNKLGVKLWAGGSNNMNETQARRPRPAACPRVATTSTGADCRFKSIDQSI